MRILLDIFVVILAAIFFAAFVLPLVVIAAMRWIEWLAKKFGVDVR